LDYSYVAYDSELQLAEGVISATSESVASQMLAKRGWKVLRLKPNQPLLPSLGRLFSFLSRPRTSDIVIFSRQLALLIESGISISRALRLLANQTTDKRLQKVINQVNSDISGGTTLSAALAKHPGTFPPMYAKLMAVAEHTGHSEEILRQLADYMERQHAATSRLRTAMAYPALILCVSIVVVTVLMTVALPPLVGLFKGLGVRLPVTTRILMAVVELVLGNWMFIFPILLVLLLGAVLYTRTEAGRYRFHQLLVRVPLLGRVILLSELGRCCRSMSLMFGVGLPAHEVLALASSSAGNLVVRQAIGEVGQAVIRGESLSGAMAQNSVFLPIMVDMTTVGEETGHPDETLTAVAQTFDVETDDRIRRLIGMIEPAMTVAVGLVVGFIALSIFMPLYGILGAMP
jgi:type IV pilus assembly protein PilC